MLVESRTALLAAEVNLPCWSTVMFARVYVPGVTAVLSRSTVMVPVVVIGLPVLVRPTPPVTVTLVTVPVAPPPGRLDQRMRLLVPAGPIVVSETSRISNSSLLAAVARRLSWLILRVAMFLKVLL